MPKCTVCGKEIERTPYTNPTICSPACFDENFWNKCLDDSAIIIDGTCYHDGGLNLNPTQKILGHGGKMFFIKKNDGVVVQTTFGSTGKCRRTGTLKIMQDLSRRMNFMNEKPYSIYQAYTDIMRLHATEHPELRIGQLMENFRVWLQEKYRITIFDLDNVRFTRLLEEFLTEGEMKDANDRV